MMDSLRENLVLCFKTMFLVLLVFVAIRLFEYGYVSLVLDRSVSFDLLLSRSINYDSLTIMLVFLLAVIPIQLIGFLSRAFARYATVGIGLLLILSDLFLTQYFLINNTLLGSEILDFSGSDVFDIVSNEFVLNRAILWLVTIIVSVISVSILVRIPTKWNTTKTWDFVLIACFCVLGIVSFANRKSRVKSIVHFQNKFEFHIGNSKLMYLFSSCEQRFKDSDTAFENVDDAISKYQSDLSWFSFSNSEFPLIHDEPYENVLGPFFRSSDTPPNVVIVISESLSATFSGAHTAFDHGLTPFTDSLAQNGLHWSMFFSNAMRSNGVLPNILASLPFGVGPRGFINMDFSYPNMRSYPKHSGLIGILGTNGYETNYFYGGWGDFDQVGRYLKEVGIDHFTSKEDFEPWKYSLAQDGWGYNDKDLFRKSFEVMNEFSDDGKPFLNVYQTISFHSPFNMSDAEYYTDEYLATKFRELGFSEDQKPELPSEQISSIFYADDALKLLFDEFKKRDDFDNTIFIITGDHSVDLGLSYHAFENFHVPLIIYSSLLNTSMEFKGACSHLDILPSVVALMKENYGLSVPTEKHWIGRGLDTAKDHRFERMIPLEMSSQDLPNFIWNDTVIFANSCWKIDSRFYLNRLDVSGENEAETVFDSYKKINAFVCTEDRIWPNH